eukprot:TRINITY_DN40899_c0_g1_i1.p1 TRINITY_DN40899_c0_g1~~TRINITY_DN40899_c0_g1_i1.p1  ORF type:complete len:173 (-),score=38.37 TRINITY_DN40899_c0_g1_i1:176-694(-)
MMMMKRSFVVLCCLLSGCAAVQNQPQSHPTETKAQPKQQKVQQQPSKPQQQVHPEQKQQQLFNHPDKSSPSNHQPHRFLPDVPDKKGWDARSKQALTNLARMEANLGHHKIYQFSGPRPNFKAKEQIYLARHPEVVAEAMMAPEKSALAQQRQRRHRHRGHGHRRKVFLFQA